MKKLLLFTLIFIAFSGRSQAQEMSKSSVETSRAARNAVYLELLGNAGIASVNYERLIYLPDNAPTFALRAGMMPMANRENASKRYMHLFVPLEVTLIPSKKNISPEFGAGFTFMNTYTINKLESNEFRQDILPVFRAGLRWGMGEGRFFGRAALLVLATGNVDGFVKGSTLPWISYCFGYRFGKR